MLIDELIIAYSNLVNIVVSPVLIDQISQFAPHPHFDKPNNYNDIKFCLCETYGGLTRFLRRLKIMVS